MGQTLSTPEKVLKYSRAGDYGSLRVSKALSAQLQSKLGSLPL